MELCPYCPERELSRRYQNVQRKAVNVTETKGRPVCGTDKQTYPTRCHLIRAQCSGHQVSLKHRGSCRDPSFSECAESRSYALSHRNSSPSKFVPRCRADGSFAPVQCMEGSGCWCSDSNGIPIPGTATRNGKPNCRRYGKSNIRRATNISSRNKRGCTQHDQAAFNTNLIEVFQREYARYQGQQVVGDGGSIREESVVDWKFKALDTNNNNMLDKTEYREFKRLVKKVIKPKRCARSFGKFCDKDQDERLSKSEWVRCLSKDGVSRAPPSFAGANKGDGHKNGVSSPHNNWLSMNHGLVAEDFDGEEDDGSDQHSDDYEDEYDEDLPDEGSRIGILGSGRHSNQPVTQYPPHLLRTNVTSDPNQMQSKSESESDCLADRATALDEQQHGATALYVPECTADGRYQRIQCYKSTGYCWCVNEDTGQNIPGTSVKDKQPQCDSISRPMKGCPEPKKTEFLKDLKIFLKEKVAFTTVNTTKFSSEDEKIATLSFVLLDKNKNKFWERKEWKTFRELVTASKSLKKCGKKMPRYCDVNGDKRITLSEWLNCLQAVPRVRTPEVAKPAIDTEEAVHG
ncbi:LOW QUALITY PROTEIN: SPARC-related modular calcium-binding protein 1 [Hermetia illucens]|uniref:LOW QUALITY PROTEIN: SPARC-related modular calcium-binding protein 1 n=1 Tax=Hermetia illucens TaxID=343691 RepID=UPI0018CBFF8C|nr:LOW QUALITY PROTEIN: SPARC-related modular calcium-binding protein 1 [Hermetia illucens]